MRLAASVQRKTTHTFGPSRDQRSFVRQLIGINLSTARWLSFPVLHETAVYADYLAITLGERQLRSYRSPFMALVRRSPRPPGMPDAFDRAPLR
jgi:hypothetical protein